MEILGAESDLQTLEAFFCSILNHQTPPLNAHMPLPVCYRWYHYDLSRHAAEALLLSNGLDGSYLLRNSKEGPSCFALSVRSVDCSFRFSLNWTCRDS